MSKYRDRIYAHYVDAWDESKVPGDVSDLKGRLPTMRHVIRKFFPVEKSAAILDLGCGHGTLVYYAHLLGFRNTFGVDSSSQQVSLAKKLGIPNVTLGDLMTTLRGITPGSLDVVVAFDVIEHFTKDELIDLVDAVYLVLKPHGRWIIHTPNGCSPFFGAVRYGDFSHEQAFTPASIEQLLKASGYKRVECEECGPRIHGIKSALRVVVWKITCLLYGIALVAETGDYKRGSIMSQNFYAVGYK
jgi:2-polyprenyl-3-methyl-5-hydroxy-6-metoxy-1,4-benzoquinol methylase